MKSLILFAFLSSSAFALSVLPNGKRYKGVTVLKTITDTITIRESAPERKEKERKIKEDQIQKAKRKKTS